MLDETGKMIYNANYKSMPRRKTIITTGEIYHIFNRSVAGIPIFKGERENKIFLQAMRFYLQPKPPTRFSIYRKSPNSFPISVDKKIVTIISYCLMPNHFHLLLKQNQDNGIVQFIQRVTNSFAHYFNIKYKRKGHVFEDKFKAVHIDNVEQLMHLSRYIHLNPVTSFIVEDPSDYPNSSYRIYLSLETSEVVDPSVVLINFSSPEKYREFVLSRKDYQRKLDEIKHLLLE